MVTGRVRTPVLCLGHQDKPPPHKCAGHRPTRLTHNNRQQTGTMGGRGGAPQNTTIQSNRAAYTPEHKSTWKYSDTNTLTPTLTLSAADTKLQTTTFSIGLGPQKTQKCGNTGSPCSDQPVLGQGGRVTP